MIKKLAWPRTPQILLQTDGEDGQPMNFCNASLPYNQFGKSQPFPNPVF
jgi:hypothetical protein